MEMYAEFEMGFCNFYECVTFQHQDNYWQVLCNFTMIFFTSNKSGMLVFSDSVPPQ